MSYGPFSRRGFKGARARVFWPMMIAEIILIVQNVDYGHIIFKDL
jgi:hypothetical protein